MRAFQVTFWLLWGHGNKTRRKPGVTPGYRDPQKLGIKGDRENTCLEAGSGLELMNTLLALTC